MNKDSIRLIVADIDGCFTAGGRSHLDLDMVRKVAEWNTLSRNDDTVPALVFCTGRPLPYIQALSQAVRAYLPSIAEFGAVLWCPQTQTHAIHPAYSPEDRRLYQQILAEAEEEFADLGKGVLIEAGKVCQLTLYPKKPLTVDDLEERTATFAERWRHFYVIDKTAAVMSYMPKTVNKGTAIEWLSEQTGIPLGQMAGIGDSHSDWHFMKRCGVSACPSKAHEEVLSQADWVLDCGAVGCIVEFYERLIAYNRNGAMGRDDAAAG